MRLIQIMTIATSLFVPHLAFAVPVDVNLRGTTLPESVVVNIPLVRGSGPATMVLTGFDLEFEECSFQNFVLYRLLL